MVSYPDKIAFRPRKKNVKLTPRNMIKEEIHINPKIGGVSKSLMLSQCKRIYDATLKKTI